jgi:hypothetical protein
MESQIRTVRRVATRELRKVDLDMPRYTGQARKDMQAWRTTVAAVVKATKAGKPVSERLHQQVDELVRTETIGRRMAGLK